MAKAAKKNVAKGGKKKAATSGRGKYTILSWVLAPLIYIVFFPTALLFTAGMIPTIVAFVIDRGPNRYTTKTVAWMNVTGVFSICIQMWGGDHSVDKALELLGDPLNLVIMFGAAAFGWLIYFSVRPVVATYVAVKAEAQRKALRARQSELVKEWGNEVRQGAAELEASLKRSGKHKKQESEPEDEEEGGTPPPPPAADTGEPSEQAGQVKEPVS